MFFSGVFWVFATIMYIFYGFQLTDLIKSARDDNLGNKKLLLNRVRGVTYGPVAMGLAQWAWTFLTWIFFSRHAVLFLLCQSINNTIEIVVIVIFLYGIILNI
eukprot:jgi/Hompol1/3527/HPOL_006588-RA